MVFWSICLANLLKNFRWLNYQLKPYFVQGDKSHLYIIQFTRYSSMSPRGDSFSLAYSLPFVKNFFRSFSRNFHAPFWAEFFDFLRCSSQTSSVCIAICLPLSRALRYTITPQPICQHLFSSFFKKLHFVYSPTLGIEKGAPFGAPVLSLSYYGVSSIRP